MKGYNSIELFAGAGGLALGLEQAGFKHIGLVEFDRAAADTLITNRKEWKVLCEDVEIVAARDLEAEFNVKKGELDLLSGGAPCQSFSYAGKRLGLDDVRGTMFYHYEHFAAIKLGEVKSGGHGNVYDEMIFDYHIYSGE